MSEGERGQARTTLGYESDRNAPDHDHMYRRHLLKTPAPDPLAVARRKHTHGSITKAPDCISTSTVTVIRTRLSYVTPAPNSRASMNDSKLFPQQTSAHRRRSQP